EGVVVAGGEDDDLHAFVVESPADLDAVEARHHHVEHDDRGMGRLAELQRQVAVAGLDDLVVVGLEDGADQPPDHVVVVDDEHDTTFHRRHWKSESTLASPDLYRRTTSSCSRSIGANMAWRLLDTSRSSALSS